MTLAGVPVLLTGASGGIGSSLAAALADKHAQLALHGRDRSRLGELSARLGAHAIVGDLRDPGACEEAVQRALEALGGLEIVVSNAGAGRAARLGDMDEASLEELLDLNLAAPLRLARAALPHLRHAAEQGRRPQLLFVASIAGHLGVPLEAPYSAAKAGLLAAAEAIAEEERPFGIRVGVVSPGAVSTEFFARRGLEYERRIPRPIPPGRVVSDVVGVLEGRRVEAISPRWLRVAAVVKAASPTLYRALASRMP